MKKIICPLFVLMLVFFLSSHVCAQTQSLPPVRTVDPVRVVHPVTASLPIKAGAEGGIKSMQPAGGLKTTVMPVKQGAAGVAAMAGAAGGSKVVSGGQPGMQTGAAG